MAVLAEAYSVIIKKSSIEQRFPGGWEAFVDFVPNNTLCFDDEIARVGFMSGTDADKFVAELVEKGLTGVVNDKAVDVAQVNQNDGVTSPCDWLRFHRLEHSESASKLIPVCVFYDGPELDHADTSIFLQGDPPRLDISLPVDWKYQGSFSESNQSYSPEEMAERFEFLRTEDGLDVYLDKETNKEVVTGSYKREDELSK